MSCAQFIVRAITPYGPSPPACREALCELRLPHSGNHQAPIELHCISHVAISDYQAILFQIYQCQQGQLANQERKLRHEANCSLLNSKVPTIQQYRPVLMKIHRLDLPIKLECLKHTQFGIDYHFAFYFRKMSSFLPKAELRSRQPQFCED